MGLIAQAFTATALRVLVTALPIAAFVYAITFFIHRVYFDSLSKYPGPRLAAFTFFYEYYFEGVRHFDYLWKIKALHEEYGPVIRINPGEIHIDDPEFFDTLNTYKGKWNKEEATSKQFTNPAATISTIDHDLHYKRRAAVSPFFARQKVLDLEPLIQGMVDKFCDRLSEYTKTQEEVPMRWAYKSFCTDTATEYGFATNAKLIDKPKFNADHWRAFDAGVEAALRSKHFPWWFLPIIKKTPGWLRTRIEPGAMNSGAWHIEWADKVDDIHSQKGVDIRALSGHRTIFHEIMNNKYLPDEEKTPARVNQEAIAMMGAAGESTSHVLDVLTFSVLQRPDVLQKIREELQTVVPDIDTGAPSLRDLENLPYLAACIKEALRLRTGKIARHQRVPRDCSLFYGDLEIKAGTVVSMTPSFNHINSDIFPDPFSFKPERWINITETERRYLERFLVPFSRGCRMCSGLNLAMAMMNMVFAAVITKFDLELYKTTAWDINMTVDRYTYAPVRGSQGSRVLLKNRAF